MKKKRLFSELEQDLQKMHGMQFLPLGMFPKFEIVETLKPQETEAVSVSSEEDSDNCEDYIELGQRLLTLAKSMLPKHRDYTPIKKKLALLEYKQNAGLEEILKTVSKVIRPVLRSLEQDVADCDAVKELQALTPHIPWRLATWEELYSEPESPLCPDDCFHGSFADGVGVYAVSRKRRADPKEQVLYLYCPTVFPKMILCGLKMSTSRYKNNMFRNGSHGHIRIVDMAYAISYLYVLDTVFSNLIAEDMQKAVSCKLIAGCTGDIFSRGNIVFSDKQMRERWMNGKCVSPSMPEKVILCVQGSEDYSRNAKFKAYLERKGCKNAYIVKKDARFDFSEHEIGPLFDGILPDFVLKSLRMDSADRDYIGSNFEHEMQYALRNTVYIGTVPVILTENDLASYMVWDSQNGVFTAEDMEAFICLYENAAGYECREHALPGLWRTTDYHVSTGLLLNLFLSFSKVMEREVQTIEETERENNVTHARSFEQKKNIPQKILAIMKTSILNERFGYIEYDEMCDTSKIATVNAQLLDFVNTYFPNENLNDVSLRFRRLGNHKANGLYYPQYRCIAVELSHPSSFVHEFGHMLDHQNGNISNTLNSLAFASVYQKYVELFDEKLERVPEQRERYRSGGKKSKYAYYTKETEVFARCFEMYITSVLNLDNSIIKSREEYEESVFVYHLENTAFMGIVKDFFHELSFMQDLISVVENSNTETVA